MGKKFVAYTVVLTTLVLSLVSFGCRETAQEKQQPEDIHAALNRIESHLSWVDYRLGQETWREYAHGWSDSLDFFRALRASVLDDKMLTAPDATVQAQLTDEQERRRYQLLRRQAASAGLDQGENVKPLRDSLDEFFSHPWCDLGDAVVTPEEAAYVMTTDRRRSEREAAYRAMTSPGQLTAEQIARLFRVRNQVARRHGYNDYLSYLSSLYDWDTPAYQVLLGRLDSLTAGPYRRLLEELRAGFRDESFDIWDWDNRFANTLSEADEYFPVDSQLNMARRSFAAMGFNLDKMPIYIDLIPADDGRADVRTVAVRVPGDIRVVTRLTPGIPSLRRLLQGLGEAVHLASIGQESELLARGSAPVWRDGIELFFSRLPMQPEWLKEYGHVPSELVDRYVRASDAVDLLQLRLLLVDARFELEAYRNPDRDFNELYWNLYAEHAGFPQHQDLTPWAAQPEYIAAPLDSRDRLLARMVAAQTRAYLVDRFGTTVDSPEIGSFLVYSFFRFGGRYDWLEMFERATDRDLSPTVLVSR